MLKPQDLNAVSGQIAALDQSLSRLEAIESKLSGELNELRANIDELRNQRATLQSRIALVWSLPNEILSYIFEIGVADENQAATSKDTDGDADGDADGDDDENENDDDNDGVQLSFKILVSHVCRAFREIAINTPALWSEIRIIDLEPPRLDFVRACVQRSGCSGLHISITCHDPDLDLNPEPISQLMAILDPHTHRFERFTVRLYGFGPLYHVMQNLNKPAPQLIHLELTDEDYEHGFHEEESFDPLPEPLTLFGGMMPKLLSLTLDGVHVSWATCNFNGLMHLTLGYHTLDVRPTYEIFKSIIDASPALRSLALTGSAPLISDDNAESSLYTPLQMEQLENLHISDISSDYAATLISLFNCPNLVSLSLTDLDTNDYSAFFRQIIGPPVLFPALTSLKLASIEINDNTIEDLFRSSSKLTHLELYFKDASSWLSFLEPQSPDKIVLCPKLKCLRCVNASISDLKRLLEKRQEVGFSIPTLQVDNETGTSEGTDWDWIKENVTLEIIEPSEHGSTDDIDEARSVWSDDEIAGFPYFTMEGFSDDEEDEDEDEDYEDASEMDVDETDDSGNEEE